MAVIEAIETVYLEADAATVEFTSIPQTYEHLQIRVNGRGTRATDTMYHYLQFGTGGGAVDTGANYAFHEMYAYSTTVGAASGTGETGIKLHMMAAANLDAAVYGAQIIDILDYANANKNTTTLTHEGVASDPNMYFLSGLWDATGAVDRIKWSSPVGSFVRGSEFTLYGIQDS
jgi:hypothetical protein